MSWVWNLNLIRVFDFYLALAFLLSTVLRLRQYHAILALVRAVPGRWPRLFQLVKQHRAIFMTWATLMPAVLALVLMVIQWMASRLVWEQADLPLAVLREMLPAAAVIGALGAAMVAMDGYACWNVGELDRARLEKDFDQAEYWLRTWKAPVVRWLTFGYVNPRKMVTVEVQTALIDASKALNSTLWWVSAQAALRIAFGLAVWLTYALTVVWGR
jgi:hypothetical protein